MDVNTTNTTAKKRILALALALILLLLALTRVTLSYFTDTKKATNTFTYGKVSIAQLESNTKSGDFSSVTGLNYDHFLPVQNSSADIVTIRNDENYKWKRIQVKNNGTEDAYVRTFIRVPAKLVNNTCPILHLDFGTIGTWYSYESGDYTVYYYTHDSALASTGSIDNLLNGVYLDSHANITTVAGGSPSKKYLVYEKNNGGVYNSGIEVTEATKLYVEVSTQAVQKSGFNGVADAFAATFGSNDPWGGSITTTTPNP